MGVLAELTPEFMVVSLLATLHVCSTSCMLVVDFNVKNVYVEIISLLLAKDVSKIMLMLIYPHDWNVLMKTELK